MGSSKRRREQKRSAPFVMLSWELLNSEAYIKLTSSAAKALPYLIGKDGKAVRKSGEANPTIEFTYGEAKRLGFATRTFSRVIKELVSKGFIDPIEHGGLRGLCKSTNKFRLSSRWKFYGKPEFKVLNWERAEPLVKGMEYAQAA